MKTFLIDYVKTADRRYRTALVRAEDFDAAIDAIEADEGAVEMVSWDELSDEGVILTLDDQDQPHFGPS